MSFWYNIIFHIILKLSNLEVEHIKNVCAQSIVLLLNNSLNYIILCIICVCMVDSSSIALFFL